MTDHTNDLHSRIIPTGPATAILPDSAGHGPPITIIGTEKIRAGFDVRCLQQAVKKNQRS